MNNSFGQCKPAVSEIDHHHSMYLNKDQLLLVLLMIELSEHLPEAIKSSASSEIDDAWVLHETIRRNDERQ